MNLEELIAHVAGLERRLDDMEIVIDDQENRISMVEMDTDLEERVRDLERGDL